MTKAGTTVGPIDCEARRRPAETALLSRYNVGRAAGMAGTGAAMISGAAVGFAGGRCGLRPHRGELSEKLDPAAQPLPVPAASVPAAGARRGLHPGRAISGGNAPPEYLRGPAFASH